MASLALKSVKSLRLNRVNPSVFVRTFAEQPDLKLKPKEVLYHFYIVI